MQRASTPVGSRAGRYHVMCDGKEIPILGELLVGRAPECDLLLGGGLVSRRHARFVFVDEGLVVEDLASRNGVLVNQRKIQKPTLLSHGDTVGIGLATLEIVDTLLLDHPPHLSTLPPGPVAFGDADVDGPPQVTRVASLGMLSDREREVLRLIVLGHTQREMSEMLHISVKTVETHRARIAEKLGCRTRAEIVSYAISAGLLRQP